MTYEEYERIVRMLLHKVHDYEVKASGRRSGRVKSRMSKNFPTNPDLEFIKQKELVDWYIERNMAQLEDEKDLRSLTKIVNSCIKKMIDEDRNLMVEEDNEK